jgi:hypothetical protein
MNSNPRITLNNQEFLLVHESFKQAIKRSLKRGKDELTGPLRHAAKHATTSETQSSLLFCNPDATRKKSSHAPLNMRGNTHTLSIPVASMATNARLLRKSCSASNQQSPLPVTALPNPEPAIAGQPCPLEMNDID